MKEVYYQSPFSLRYASPEMRRVFSPQFKYATWRRLWVALAEAQAALGLPITKKQISSLKKHVDSIDFKAVQAYEDKLRHDVMAHIHAYGDQCPEAKPIIHLGATSCYVTDNGDLIQMRGGLEIIQRRLASILDLFSKFAKRYASMACLAYTHFQPAQPTTIGKRACLWLQDFLMDFHSITESISSLRFLGVKGTTGTQASFLALFEENFKKVEELDKLVADAMGFQNVYRIAGQTYARKQDVAVMNALAGIAISAHKFGTDIRLLAHTKEIEEPFEVKQVGSSAMPYKRNPIISEKVCGLSRFLISIAQNGSYTAALQWLERSLDDSSNRRIVVPEAFLACDAILSSVEEMISGLIVNGKVVERHLMEELPFFATENILMACVKKGKDRQAVHERLRQHSCEVAKHLKEKGGDNNLLHRLKTDSFFGLSEAEWKRVIDVSAFVGVAPKQVEVFLKEEVAPILAKYRKNKRSSKPC